MAKIGIAGGSGYGGAELVQILIGHPRAELTWISSQQHAGKEVGEVYPHLRGLLKQNFSPIEELSPSDLDVLFLALPHGEATKIVPGLPEDLVVIDLSGDFRIKDPDTFEKFYHFPLESPQEQKKFVYGLTELNRQEIRAARRIANPGCFASATLLALHPLFREEWIEGPVFVDAKTGSSGAGRSPGPTTHHPWRSNSLFPYKPFSHQHLPEITQALGEPGNPVIFQPYAAPFVRGIFASHYMQLGKRATVKDLSHLYQDYYESEFFVRWVPDCPNVNSVRHSNFVDIGGITENGFLIVWSVLDNLQKGAAGQAIQNMNVILNFPEKMALEHTPMNP
ncbi:MAG: N-acetyl-gamma-glutamyl-phosphate reductase [Acidobacteriota bacterium]|nr:N-acetyl-gamma-glutamyl-phosphate reductase [Acidobacteriota bacterium]